MPSCGVEAASQGMSSDPPSLRQAMAAYEQAVALDSTFVAGVGAARPRRRQSCTPWQRHAGRGRGGAPCGGAGAGVAPTRAEGIRPWRRITASCWRQPPRAHRRQHRVALAPGERRAARHLWGRTNSSSAAGRRRAAPGTGRQARSPLTRTVRRLGLCCLHPPLPRGRAGPRSRARARAGEPGGSRERVLVALAQGDLAGRTDGAPEPPKEVDPTELVASWRARPALGAGRGPAAVPVAVEAERLR